MVAQCAVCLKRFAKPSQLVNQIRTHTGAKPFKCDVCSAVFSLKSSLRDHALTHLDNRKLFKCMLCYFSTHIFDKIERHATARHNGSLRFLKSTPCANLNKRQAARFKCSRCLLDCRSRVNEIIAHLSKHTGIKPFECDHCNQAFPRATALSNHRRRFHGNEDESIRCPICSNAFACHVNLTAHMHRVHLREKPYSCDVCPKRFSTAAAARQHRQAHRGERFIKCDLCPKTFLTNTQLRIHKSWAHEGVRPFKCSICCNGFIQKAPMTAHLLTVHVGVKAFSCNVCDAKFSSAGALGVHKRIEHMSLQHRCEQCGQTFKGRKHLKLHMQYHVTSYACGQCSRKFHTKRQVNKHYAVAHGNQILAHEFKCAICLAGFRAKHNLLSHNQRMHKPKESLHCKRCTKQFASCEGLRSHWRVAHATNVPLFACAKCSWVTKVKCSLSTHLRLMHPANNQPRFKCAQCESVSYHRTQLAQHLRKVHIAKTTRYGCAICGKVYARIYPLLDHQRLFGGTCYKDRQIERRLCGDY